MHELKSTSRTVAQSTGYALTIKTYRDNIFMMEDVKTKSLKWVKVARYRMWLCLFVLSALICIGALRHNNQTMVHLRNDLYAADQNNGNVEAALDKLRVYVYGHMNTSLSGGNNTIKPPVQLKYTYQRLADAEQEKVNTQNANVYTQAQAYCEAQNSVDFSGRNRVPCIQQYVSDHGTKPQSIPAALYQFDFVSPAWSPDFAGWSIVATIILLIITSISFLRYKIPQIRSLN
jgi:hypothetical protein